MSNDDPLWSHWGPWRHIPTAYNLGADLTTGQVARGHGDRPALLWENAAGAARTVTYRELDVLTNRLAGSLHRLHHPLEPPWDSRVGVERSVARDPRIRALARHRYQRVRGS